MTTLKISDLSVGDWVEIDHEVFGWQPAQINVCGDLGIGVYLKDIDPEEEYECTLSQARPIPITAEILEKNGFEFDKASRWHICELEDKTRINVWIGRNNEGRIEVSKPAPFDDGYHFKYADIEVLNIAVHQLQHALRLAGVDKEINL